MTREEINTLLRSIAGTYPEMKITRDLANEWEKRLADYDYEDIEKAFNNYVISGNKTPITLVDLIRGQKTKSQKKPLKGDFFCMICNKHYSSIEECDKCYEKDLDIRYINKMSKIFNLEIGKYFRTLETIDQREYDNFMKAIVQKQIDEPKLKGLELEGLRTYYKHVLKG